MHPPEPTATRVLASAASLFGAAEAPRDAATVPLLLGLDGRQYLLTSAGTVLFAFALPEGATAPKHPKAH